MSRKSDRQFDFTPTWEERIRELRARLTSCVAAAAQLADVPWAHVHEFLMAVASHESQVRGVPGRACIASIDQLAETAGLSIDQAKRARVNAKRLGLVTTLRRSSAGARLDDAVRIVDAKVDELASRSRELAHYDAAHGTAPSCSQLRSAAPTLAPPAPNPRSAALTYKEPNPDPNSKSSSSFTVPAEPNSETLGAAGAPRPDWSAVEEDLFLCGMNQAPKAVRAARAGGATPEQVLALAAWWRLREDRWVYPVPELFWRVSRAGAEADVADGWGPPRPGWVDPDVAAASEARRVVQLREQAEREQAEAAAAELAATDEAAFGPLVDALADDAIAELLAGDEEQLMRRHWRRNGRTPLLRLHLIDKIAKRNSNVNNPTKPQETTGRLHGLEAR